VQVMANNVAIGFEGATGHLEMNVYNPLIAKITQFTTFLADGCTNFRRFLVKAPRGRSPRKIAQYVESSLVLVRALHR
jgi:fumarate hydratase, class II